MGLAEDPELLNTNAFCAFVQLDPEQVSTAKKPFNALSVYVGLQQEGDDVRIYAAGVMEVNRKVVPNLVVFDASGIAGDQAGKGTLWLNGHFEQIKAAAKGRRRKDLIRGLRGRFRGFAKRDS